MGWHMKRISLERKAATLAKLLPPYNMTVAAVAPMEEISEATLYNWRNQAKSEGKPVPGAENNSELTPSQYPYQAKSEIRTFLMTSGKFCRSQVI